MKNNDGKEPERKRESCAIQSINNIIARIQKTHTAKIEPNKEEMLDKVRARYMRKIEEITLARKLRQLRATQQIKQLKILKVKFSSEVHSRIRNATQILSGAHGFFGLLQDVANLLAEFKLFSVQVGVSAAIHKSYHYTKNELDSRLYKFQCSVIKEMITEVNWQKYIHWVSLCTKLNLQPIRIEDFQNNPSLQTLCNKTFLPLLKKLVPSSCKILNCLELKRKTCRKKNSKSTNDKRFEIVNVAMSIKDSLLLHRDFLKICHPITHIDKEELFNKKPFLLTRHLLTGNTNFIPFDYRVFYCPGDSHSTPLSTYVSLEPTTLVYAHLELTGTNSFSYKIKLSNGKHFKLIECTNDLISATKKDMLPENIYMLDVPSFYHYYHLSHDDQLLLLQKPLIRLASIEERAELAVLLFRPCEEAQKIVEASFCDLANSIPSSIYFAGIKNNNGVLYLVVFTPNINKGDQEFQTPLPGLCVWPSCLQNRVQKDTLEKENFSQKSNAVALTLNFVNKTSYSHIESMFDSLPCFSNKYRSGNLNPLRSVQACSMHCDILQRELKKHTCFFNLDLEKEFHWKVFGKTPKHEGIISKLDRGIIADSLKIFLNRISRVSCRFSKGQTLSYKKAKWLHTLKSAGVDISSESILNAPKDRLWSMIKSTVIRCVEQKKSQRLSEISLTGDIRNLSVFPHYILIAKKNAFKEVLSLKDTSERCEFFHTLYRKMEEEMLPKKAEAQSESAPFINSTHSTITNRWSEGNLLKLGFDSSSVQRKTPLLPQDSGMLQEKRMKQIIETYNQSIKVHWRSGSRSRPASAVNKSTKKGSSQGSNLKRSADSKDHSVLSEERTLSELKVYEQNRHYETGSQKAPILKPQRSYRAGVKIIYNPHNIHITPTTAIPQQRSVVNNFTSPSSNSRMTSAISCRRNQRSASTKFGKIYAGN